MIKIIRLEDEWNELDAYTKRNKTCPGREDEITAYEKERTDAITYFTSNQATSKKPFPFSLYNSDPFKKILIKEANNKCVYCETDASASSRYDIEHFRPKGKVTCSENRKLSNGYYWLAGDWDNLFLSCQLCNRRNKHRYTDSETGCTGGKGNLFPLSDEAARVHTQSCAINDEEQVRLLIDPAKDDPADHLFFNENGEIFGRDKKGKTTIKVLALRRLPLHKKRNEVLKNFKNSFYLLVKSLNNVEAANKVDRAELLEDLKKNMDSFCAYLQVNKEYLAMKRDWLKYYTNKEERKCLETFSIDVEKLYTA